MPIPRAALAFVLTLGACATANSACERDPITGSSMCRPASGSYVEAAATVAAAGAAWAVVGCTVNDCEPPFRCNHKTKLCERIRCDEGEDSCPPAYVCDPVERVCR